MPLELKDALKKGIESYECTWNFPDAKKGIQRTLNGLKKQVIALRNATVGIFFDRNQDVQFQWNENLNWLKKKIEQCEKCAEFPAKEEKDFLNKLNSLSQKWVLNLNALVEMNDCSEKNSKILEKIHYKFTKNKEKNLQLFKEIEDKIQKLKTKIELQDPILRNLDYPEKKFLDNLILRIKDTVSKSDILTEFDETFKKDANQLEDYEQLKNVWLTSLIKFKSLEMQIEKSLLDFATLPIIIEFSTNLQKQKLYFESLNRDLEAFSVTTLTAGFKEKYQKEASEIDHLTEDDQYRYMRPLNEFLLNIAAYKINLNKFIENEKVLAELNLNCNKRLPVIKDALSKISDLINLINASTENESLDFVNEKMKDELIKQKQNSITLFNDYLSNLEDSWNQCCLDLNDVNFQKKTFASFKNITEKMAWCHLMAENMQSTIRNQRKSENNRFRHHSLFENQCQSFQKLCKLILQSNLTNSIEKIQILDIPSHYYDEEKLNDEIETLFPSNQKHSLKNEYDSLMSKAEAIDPVSKNEVYLIEDLSSEHLMGNIGLIWSSDEKEEKVFKEYQKQKTAFDKDLKQRQEKIHIAFTETLPNICKITTKELNWEGETLSSTIDTYYDNHFTEAYYPENRAGKALQIVGGYAANAIKWTGQAVLNKVNEKLGYQIGYHSEYQHEELPMATETFEFTSLISPFDEMKKLI